MLYSDCEYDVITWIQPETKLMELEKEKKKINVKIAKPKIKKRSFFSKDQLLFQITDEFINKLSIENALFKLIEVNKDYEDFNSDISLSKNEDWFIWLSQISSLYSIYINNLELGLTSGVFLLTVKNHINFLTELLKINFLIKYPFPFFSLFSKY